MKIIVGLIAFVSGSYLLHRTALWMEARGWIYYRRRHGSSGAIGNAFMEVQSLLEPGKRHVVQVKRAEAVEQDPDGHPIESGNE